MPAIPYLSVLEIGGADARDFLHRQLSADIEALSDGEATFACLCQPKGRVIALLLVQAFGRGVRVVCSRDLTETVKRRLSLYVLRDDVRIETRDDLLVHGVDSSAAGDLLQPLPGLAYTLRAGEYAVDNDAQAWKSKELQHGVSWLGAATSEQFLPQMLGYEAIGALSFRKGCYPGQEIIARTRYLGSLKRNALLVRATATIASDPLEAVSLANGGEEANAVVVDCAPVDEGTLLLLVARAQTAFSPSALLFRGDTYPIESHWLAKGAG